ncbi:MAG: amidohydrolase family protein [Alphaproteobacteria bacterium]|nr:amidohydrolase family protein [Alphaproteobacteria bacterium]MBV9370286.1 amidohydrolase family protein [Alphaproteobacteria bacterium]MBV9899771.1 amidohydrolase family protein [Alphaproteobacteria bacterium]
MAMRAGLGLLVLVASGAASARPPIIDMHLHARRLGPIEGAPALCAPPPANPRWDNGRPIGEGLSVPSCAHPLRPAASGEEVMRETLAILARRNIIAMASGEPADIARWRSAAPERIIAGLDLRITPRPPSARFQPRSPAEVRALHAAGAFQVLGEVMAQYEGVAADDPRLEPYWALAEALDIPVAIHMGPGGGGDAYSGSGAYRVRDSSPLKLEDVLVRHPRLRVYIMHAGFPMIDDLLALMEAHPQVYVDIAAIVATEPKPAFYRYLREIVEAGYGDRIMFGTDQGVWPGLIEAAIRTIERAPFLSARRKRDILYNNAARFLRLTPAQVSRHWRM